jgi:hypothetical protein
VTYRVQVQVGVDVDAITDGEAMAKAIIKVRDAIGEDPEAPHPKELWVTGICRDMDGDYMAWEQAE